MDKEPPRKSRRIATAKHAKGKNKSVQQGNENSTNQQNFQDMLVAAIPMITQSVVSVLQQKGLIVSNNEVISHNQVGNSATDVDTEQSTSGTEISNIINSGNVSTNSMLSNHSLDEASTPAVTCTSTNPAFTDGNVGIIPYANPSSVEVNNHGIPAPTQNVGSQSVLPGSSNIPRTDLSPSVNADRSSIATNVSNILVQDAGINHSISNTCNTLYTQGSISSPLTLHVEPKIKSQIWANMYVNFEVLLPKKELKTPRYKFYDGEKEGNGVLGFVKEQYVSTQIRNMSQWLEAFHIFVGCYCEKYPQDSVDLMKYCSIVRSIAKNATDEAALSYDKAFRKLRQGDPLHVKWDHLNSELYFLALAEGLSTKMRDAEQQLFLAKFKSSTKSQRKFTCHDYNNNGKCTRKNCRFGHSCQCCGGSHPRKTCRQWLAKSNAVRPQGSSQPIRARPNLSANLKSFVDKK